MEYHDLENDYNLMCGSIISVTTNPEYVKFSVRPLEF
jgi:hypothetical protein